MQICFLYIEINPVSMICKDLVAWVKKIRLTKEVAISKNCRFLFKFSDENNIAKLVVDMWGNCSTRLCQLTFPELNTFQIFLFHLYCRKSVNSLLNYTQNKLSKFLATFSINLWIFDLECHGQAPLKIVFVKFGNVFMKFRKLKSLHLENKKLDCHKNLVFSQHQSFPVLWVSDWHHQIGIREIVQLNSNKHVFQKQPFISVLQKSWILTGKELHQIKLQR